MALSFQHNISVQQAPTIPSTAPQNLKTVCNVQGESIVRERLTRHQLVTVTQAGTVLEDQAVLIPQHMGESVSQGHIVHKVRTFPGGYIICQFYKRSSINEPRRQKTGLRGFRPGPTQIRLHHLRKWLEA